MVELNAELAVTDLSVPAEVDMLGAIPVGYEPTSGRGGLSDEIKQAILDCFQHVAWVDPDGADYYQALYDLFFPPAELVRISAVYTQSGTVYPTTSLDSLKTDLVVKAHYSDGSAVTLSSSDYTLSGSLTVGTSTVVVTYSGKSTSFSVTVTAAPTLSSISAVYTQSGTVYDTDSLDSLKTDLVVTAHYSDSSSETVPAADYTLSGTLTEGTSSIDVFYGGKGTTFTVTVTQSSPLPSGYTGYDYVTSPSNHDNTQFANLIVLKQYANLNALSMEVQFKPISGHNDGGGLIGRRIGTNSTNSYAMYAKTGKLSWHFHGTTPSGDSQRPNITEEAVNIARFNNTSASPSSVQANDDAAISVTWSNNNTLNLAPTLFANATDNTENAISVIGKLQIGYVKFYDLSGDLVGHYLPCVRNADSIIGMYDIVGEAFYTASNTTVATDGGTGHFYEVGNWS